MVVVTEDVVVWRVGHDSGDEANARGGFVPGRGKHRPVGPDLLSAKVAEL